MRWLVIVLVGCASAGNQEPLGSVDGNTTPQPDGHQMTLDSSMPTPDGSGPMAVTLTQTTSQTLKANNSIACPGTAAGTTSANSYYRVFDLAALGITGAFNVTKVSFQIEDCVPTSSTATSCANVAVRVGTYSGTPGATLATGSMTIKASNATVTVPKVVETTTSTPGGTVDAPISTTIPAGSKLLVEVDAQNTGAYKFYMGSNDGGESGFGYVMAADCGITSPTNISSLSSTQVPAAPRHLLLTVTGTY